MRLRLHRLVLQASAETLIVEFGPASARIDWPLLRDACQLIEDYRIVQSVGGLGHKPV